MRRRKFSKTIPMALPGGPRLLVSVKTNQVATVGHVANARELPSTRELPGTCYARAGEKCHLNRSPSPQGSWHSGLRVAAPSLN